MLRYLNTKYALIVLIICCATCHAASQTGGTSEPIFINGDSNETTKAALDLLAQRAGEDKLIILIGRLGVGETSTRFIQRRLQAVRGYLESTRAIAEQRVITAEGERVRDRGRFEVYLDGRLFMVFTLGRNRNFAPEA